VRVGGPGGCALPARDGLESRQTGLFTWIFTTLSHVVFLCGKGRGGDVLDGILPKGFAGIGVTDNYAAYDNRFAKHQKCWAHFLRKIISLML
jgi:transposase